MPQANEIVSSKDETKPKQIVESKPSSSSSSSSFNPSNLPEYLRAYYKFLFPHSLFHQWLSYANVETDYFARREFSFTLANDIYLRFNSYENLTEMRRSIMERLPMKIDIGAVYNLKPKDSRQAATKLSFQPLERELVFDIDMTDYDEIRNCCRGTDICQKCWMFMIIAAHILDAFLREDFGFQQILWVYSGRRGIHCWVVDERARKLRPDSRDAIAQFINIFDGGQYKVKKVEIDGLKGVHPSIVRSIHIIDKYFIELMVKQQNFLQTKEQIEKIANLCLDQELRNEIKSTLINDKTLKDSMDRWQMLEKLSNRFYSRKGSNPNQNRHTIYRHRYFLEELKLQLCYPRLDINVTKGLNHLLKIPFSVHPKTGKICIPIDYEQIDRFDPFDVPNVEELCNELDKITTKTNENVENGAGTGGPGSMAYKTKLSKSLNLFRKFIDSMEKSLSSKKKNDSIIVEKMDF